MVLYDTWNIDLQVWGYVCAGELGRFSTNNISSIIWSGRGVPLCTQFMLLALLHFPLLFVSSFYAGEYYRRIKFKTTPRTTLQIIAVLSSLLVLTCTINFTYLIISITSENLSLVLLSVLIVKLLTWLVHTFCIVQLIYSIQYQQDRPPISAIICWLFILFITLFYFLSLVTYKVHPEWYSSIDSVFLSGDSFLYSISLELFLHSLYGTSILLSYFKHRFLLLTLRWRRVDPQSHNLLNIQHSYGSLRSYESDELTRPVNEEGVSWFSYLVFSWFEQTIKRGYKRKIETLDDLPSLPRYLRGSHLIAKFHKFYTNRQLNGKSSNKWQLLLSVVRVAGCKFYLAGILKLTADAVMFTGPLLLNGLVYLVENNNQPISMGYLYVLGLFVSSLTGMLLNVHFQYLVDKVNVSIQSALMNAVYQKVIRLDLAKLSRFSTGQVLDYMSTDASRLSSVWNVHLFWSMPVMISICLYLLYLQVGLSFLAGLAFCIAVIAINQLLTVLISRVFRKYMDCKDERIKMMSEILAGVRVIKLYAWERIFKNKIGKIRSDELKQLAWVKLLDGFCVFFWACTATMMCVLTFITYSLLGNELTAARVFTSVSLFAILIGPLNGFPLVLQWMAEAWISLQRLNNFLSVGELSEEHFYSLFPPADPNIVICIQNGKFSWDNTQLNNIRNPSEREQLLNPVERPILKGINFIVYSGQFVGIVGQVGSGKSSILSALMMELNKVDGAVYYKYLNEGFGIVSQESWIQHGTLRSNILFGLPYKPDLYEQVVSACALLPDFALAHASDLTEVGENGINLSGGQKARISLARACYQQKPCILLDDPLSAVDANVAQHIVVNCFHKLLAHRTRILITHRVELLKSVDLVLVVNQGEIVTVGSPDTVLPSVDKKFVPERDKPCNRGAVSEEETENNLKGEDAMLIKKEEKCTGSVKFKIYWSYWVSVGHFFAFLILLSMLLMEASKRFTDVWLSIWTTANISLNNTQHFPTVNTTQNSTSNSETLYYLSIYAGLSLATGLVTIIRAASFAVGTFKASKQIHSQLYHRITRATILFFDSTPIGRILNRFSSDLYTIDFDLPFNLNIFLAQIFSLTGALFITIYGLPLILVLLALLAILYILLQHYYRRTSRELKRIASISLSPVYSHFTETFTGIATIKGMKAAERFVRSYIENVDRNQQANFTSNIASGWFRIRIQMISVLVVTGVGLFAVLQHQFYLPVNPGLLGLALSYAITLTGILGSTVETFTQLEMLMVAVERIDEYTNSTPVEDTLQSSDKKSIPRRVICWAARAPSIAFEQVTLCYREGQPQALRGVSFRVEGGEKLGVVGRTGAGKSSLVRVLFRLADVSDGRILLDDVNILEYSLHQLRSNLAAIPQDPFLFSGSVRENLSPDTERFTEGEYWDSLEDTYLKQAVLQMGGLDAGVGVGGKKFSVGQRQLLCLARAILTKPRVLCIDEATANIDADTDRQIQDVIKTKFHHSTVITIAHRINTLLHCDRILVMDYGRVLEHSTPQLLLDDYNSEFFNLASQQGHQNWENTCFGATASQLL